MIEIIIYAVLFIAVLFAVTAIWPNWINHLLGAIDTKNDYFADDKDNTDFNDRHG